MTIKSLDGTVICDVLGDTLRGADLAGANLAGADLAGANLAGADLAGADLAGADLRKAYLRGADLAGADLGGADLYGAKGVGAFGPIGLHGRIGYAVSGENGPMIHLGCFWGSLDEAVAAIGKKYGDTPMGRAYVGLVRAAAEALEATKEEAK